MFVPIHKLRYLSCVPPFCGAEQSASYVFILYTYWRKISIQNSMGHPDRCGFLLFSHKICRIRTAHTANEMCMKFSCTISGCPAGARKWHISYFATPCIAKKEHHPDGWCFYLSGGFNSDISLHPSPLSSHIYLLTIMGFSSPDFHLACEHLVAGVISSGQSTWAFY